jgi:WD40 repeat protein
LDIDKQSVSLSLTGHLDTVQFVKLLSDRQTLVSCSSDWAIKVWNIYSGILLVNLFGHTDTVWACEQLNNGFLVSASNDGSIKVWNLTNYNNVQTIVNAHGAGNYVGYVRLLSNGNLASSGQDNNIKIWRTASFPYTQLLIISGHTSTIWFLESLSDGTLASASADFSVRIWNVTSGSQLGVFNPLNAKLYTVTQISSNPTVLACMGNSPSLSILNTQTGVITIVTPTGGRTQYKALVVFNSTLMIGGAYDFGQLQLFNPSTYAAGSSFNINNKWLSWLEKISIYQINIIVAVKFTFKFKIGIKNLNKNNQKIISLKRFFLKYYFLKGPVTSTTSTTSM